MEYAKNQTKGNEEEQLKSKRIQDEWNEPSRETKDSRSPENSPIKSPEKNSALKLNICSLGGTN